MVVVMVVVGAHCMLLSLVRHTNFLRRRTFEVTGIERGSSEEIYPGIEHKIYRSTAVTIKEGEEEKKRSMLNESWITDFVSA